MTIFDPISVPFPNLINFVPDTSWLLNPSSSVENAVHVIKGDGSAEPAGTSTSLFSKIRGTEPAFLSWLFLNAKREDAVQPYLVPHTWILLEEVLAEVTDLHANAREKRAGTGHAKRLIREIMEKTTFERVRGSDLEPVPLAEGSLGIDSPTDHQLLTVAIQRAVTWKGGCSIVLTGDTGLALEVSSQNRENGHRIFTSASWKELKRMAAGSLFSRHPDFSDRLYLREWCAWDACFKREDF